MWPLKWTATSIDYRGKQNYNEENDVQTRTSAKPSRAAANSTTFQSNSSFQLKIQIGKEGTEYVFFSNFQTVIKIKWNRRTLNMLLSSFFFCIFFVLKLNQKIKKNGDEPLKRKRMFFRTLAFLCDFFSLKFLFQKNDLSQKSLNLPIYTRNFHTFFLSSSHAQNSSFRPKNPRESDSLSCEPNRTNGGLGSWISQILRPPFIRDCSQYKKRVKPKGENNLFCQRSLRDGWHGGGRVKEPRAWVGGRVNSLEFKRVRSTEGEKRGWAPLG